MSAFALLGLGFHGGFGLPLAHVWNIECGILDLQCLLLRDFRSFNL